MESTTSNNNNNHMFLSEFKELRKELSAVKKRIVRLEQSHEKQQERLDILERENHALKTQLNINGNKAGESALKRKRADQDHEKEPESKPASSTSAEKKKAKTNNNKDNDEAVVLPQHDNGDSFDSLSDDLLHKVVEFDGNCYTKFGLINKRCKNIYDVEEYKLKKYTCVHGYGTVDMMLQHYLQKRREGLLDDFARLHIAEAVIWYNRLDAIDWIIQLEDSWLLRWVCLRAVDSGRINVLTKLFLKLNVTTIDKLLNDTYLCKKAAGYGKLETLKWLRNHGAEWDADTFYAARAKGYDGIIQYLRAEGCPEQDEERDEPLGSEQFGSDDEDGDN